MCVCAFEYVMGVWLAMKDSIVLWQQLWFGTGGSVVFLGWLSVLCGCGGSVLFESCVCFFLAVVVSVGGEV